jgi:hypothetical protein
MERTKIYMVERTKFEDVNGTLVLNNIIMIIYDSLDKAIQHIKMTASVYDNVVLRNEDTEEISAHFENKGIRTMESIKIESVY